jgi:3'-phosphoadenosine 5'-phosphosulfate sulfotransferase (PAPS reductase)/FAD synthetase
MSSNFVIPKWLLTFRQALPLEIKIRMTEQRIIAYYKANHGNVYISFSGGKDSTVLVDIARRLYPSIPVVFCDTGLEFPEVREFVKTIDNVTIIKPKMSFYQVLKKYGYPVISKENAQKLHDIRTTNSMKLLAKRLFGDEKGNGKLPNMYRYLIKAPFKISGKCCDIMKKRPFLKYEKDTGNSAIVGTMADNSSLRAVSYMSTGCNSFGTRNMSKPLGFWTEWDIWNYIQCFKLPIAKCYKSKENPMGCLNTGCMFCMFGIKKDKGLNRFQRMKITHPQSYKYCMGPIGLDIILNYIDIDFK